MRGPRRTTRTAKKTNGCVSVQVTKVIWQKAASPTCHPSRLQMDSSDLGPHRIHGSLDPQESALPQTASRSFQPFCTTHPCDQHTDRNTDTQTTLRATAVAIGRILCVARRRRGLKRAGVKGICWQLLKQRSYNTLDIHVGVMHKSGVYLKKEIMQGKLHYRGKGETRQT